MVFKHLTFFFFGASQQMPRMHLSLRLIVQFEFLLQTLNKLQPSKYSTTKKCNIIIAKCQEHKWNVAVWNKTEYRIKV
jgi:hypothetical protein